jgi:hypothetical protein
MSGAMISSSMAALLKTAKVGIERCKARAGWFEPIGTIGSDVSSEARVNAMRGLSDDGDMVRGTREA